MATNTRNRLCRQSDIEVVDIVKAVEDVIQNNKTLKGEVTDALKLLSERAEGLVIELVKEEMWSTAGKVIGRGIVIVGGLASIILTIPAVAALAPAGLGATCGIGGIIVGYLVWGGSTYMMNSPQEHAMKLRSIFDDVEVEVNRYTESQRRMFSVLGHLGAFDARQSFAVNLKLIKDVVEKAEMEAETFFPNIEEVISKLKRCYSSLSEDQKGKLNAEDFLVTVSSLVQGSSMPDKVDLGEVGTAVVSFIGDAVGSAPWFETIQGLNVLINAGIFRMDVKKFWELNEMRMAWNAGGEAKIKLLKNPKFKKEVAMKELINKFRDQILAEGY